MVLREPRSAPRSREQRRGWQEREQRARGGGIAGRSGGGHWELGLGSGIGHWELGLGTGSGIGHRQLVQGTGRWDWEVRADIGHHELALGADGTGIMGAGTGMLGTARQECSPRCRPREPRAPLRAPLPFQLRRLGPAPPRRAPPPPRAPPVPRRAMHVGNCSFPPVPPYLAGGCTDYSSRRAARPRMGSAAASGWGELRGPRGLRG
uniref:Uncharacterized protein n=1 Tax=Chloebia gouldiae TaxID=44316 RepID=A0A3L8RA54_CHLGU|nr:hypothetical protein DV515_00016908 [Chloebia gouldiae]RLV76511.1 hypothetical protein DV515_00016901 [Chloebia gouldiae]